MKLTICIKDGATTFTMSEPKNRGEAACLQELFDAVTKGQTIEYKTEQTDNNFSVSVVING